MVVRAGKARVGPLKIEALLPQIQLYFVESVGRLEIWRVEGKVIRDNVFIDFTEGGNYESYPWIGPNKIWIDHDVDDDEIIFVKLHELWETIYMSKGWDYDPAHDQANEHEQAARDNPEKADVMWEEAKRMYLEIVEGRK